jgi:hypothetical protein
MAALSSTTTKVTSLVHYSSLFAYIRVGDLDGLRNALLTGAHNGVNELSYYMPPDYVYDRPINDSDASAWCPQATPCNETPLLAAISRGRHHSLDMCQRLIDAKADVYYRAHTDASWMSDYASHIRLPQRENDGGVLQRAALHGACSLVAFFLAFPNINVDSGLYDERLTMLSSSSSSSSSSSLASLSTRPKTVSPMVRIKSYQATPLFRAVQRDDIEMVRLLLAADATVNIQYGYHTLLSCALDRGDTSKLPAWSYYTHRNRTPHTRTSIAKLLIDAKCNVFGDDWAMYHAIQCYNMDGVRLLLESVSCYEPQ